MNGSAVKVQEKGGELISGTVKLMAVFLRSKTWEIEKGPSMKFLELSSSAAAREAELVL